MYVTHYSTTEFSSVRRFNNNNNNNNTITSFERERLLSNPLSIVSQTRFAYHAATGEYDAEPVDDAGRADHPRQSDEQYDAEDVLHARQVDADQRAHPGRSRLGGGRLGVSVRRARYGVRVVGDRVEERGHSRPVVHFFL